MTASPAWQTMTAAELSLVRSGMWDQSAAEPPAQLPPQVDTALELIRSGLSEIECRLELQKV